MDNTRVRYGWEVGRNFTAETHLKYGEVNDDEYRFDQNYSRASETVVALFTDLKNAKMRFAICRARASAPRRSTLPMLQMEGHPDVSRAEHSVIWKLRDSFERDLHHQGASQIAGETGHGNAREVSPYTEVDLRKALSEMGVAPDRISLLEREIGEGVLVLVKCGGHSEKAEEILERNEGTIRTDTALEVAPKISAEG